MSEYITQAGKGMVNQLGTIFRLSLPPVTDETYHNAQISSYRSRRELSHKAPLRMTVRARAEGKLHGTAGFGFWNHPFAPNEGVHQLPKAVWFFHASPPSNMALALNVPGYGWKAATFDAMRWQFFALLPSAPVGFLLMRIPALYRRLWRIGQRAIGVSEYLLDSSLLADWHIYSLEWREGGVTFSVDGMPIHEADCAPHGKLGFVAWVDNQYAVVTPQGHFKYGLVDTSEPQALELEIVEIKGTHD